MSLDKKAESDSGNNIMQAMAVTSTLWPILFAAVLGPTLKALALHHAVRGVRLGVCPLNHDRTQASLTRCEDT
jgi:hypothetical protein